MSQISDIVNVQIELNTNFTSTDSFDHICIVGQRPKKWTDWAASTAYVAGDVVVSGTHVYSCEVAGSSGEAAPDHTSGTANDGTVTWKYKSEIPADVGLYANLQEVTSAGWDVLFDPVGVAARVAFSQNPKPDGLYIAVQQMDTSDLETAARTVERALSVSGWYVLCTAGVQESEFQDIANLIEAQNKMFIYTYVGENDPVDDTFYRSAGYYGREYGAQNASDVPAANLYIGVATAAKCLQYEPGSETWAYKTLAGVSASKLSSTEISKLKDSNINWYDTIGKDKLTALGKVKAGEWIDVIRLRDWIQADMQTNIMNLLKTNKKIPFTSSGIARVENVMSATLQRAQRNGGVCPDEYDTDGNQIPGYTVIVPAVSEITAAMKAARTLSDCRFEAYLAGAIHIIKIVGSLTYSG